MRWCAVKFSFFLSYSIMVSGFMLMFFVYLVLLNVGCFLILGVCLCIVSLCSDECCAFCLICEV